jgi:hypothetical protein
MRASSGKRHRELMVLSVAVTVRQQSTQCMSQEFEPDWKWCRTVEQVGSFVWRQVRNAFEVKRDRILEGAGNLLERCALNRDVEVQADRFPVSVATLGIAAQTSQSQL